MNIPKFWSKHRIETTIRDRPTVTVRWGWSAVSQADADSKAEYRCKSAVADRISGKRTAWNESRYSEDLPIREEVLDVRPEGILTRNAYGAMCINSEQVAIMDLDRPDFRFDVFSAAGKSILLLLVVGVFTLAVVNGGIHHALPVAISWALFSVMLLVGAWLFSKNAGVIDRFCQKELGALDQRAKAAGLLVHLYKTPRGWRAIVGNATCDAKSDKVNAFWSECKLVDKLYLSLCRQQGCFRARVSPKPWNIGVARIAGGKWPVAAEGAAERAAERAAWVDTYTRASGAYGAVSFIKKIGAQGRVADRTCLALMDWHDQLAGAHSNKPLA